MALSDSTVTKAGMQQWLHLNPWWQTTKGFHGGYKADTRRWLQALSMAADGLVIYGS